MASGAKLGAATRDLREAWEQMKESWRDAKRDEFERTYIDPLMDAVSASMPAIEELGQALKKIRQDCE